MTEGSVLIRGNEVGFVNIWVKNDLKHYKQDLKSKKRDISSWISKSKHLLVFFVLFKWTAGWRTTCLTGSGSFLDTFDKPQDLTTIPGAKNNNKQQVILITIIMVSQQNSNASLAARLPAPLKDLNLRSWDSKGTPGPS